MSSNFGGVSGQKNHGNQYKYLIPVTFYLTEKEGFEPLPASGKPYRKGVCETTPPFVPGFVPGIVSSVLRYQWLFAKLFCNCHSSLHITNYHALRFAILRFLFPTASTKAEYSSGVLTGSISGLSSSYSTGILLAASIIAFSSSVIGVPLLRVKCTSFPIDSDSFPINIFLS